MTSLSTVGREAGWGQRVALLSLPSPACEGDDYSVRVVTQLFTTRFLNFAASRGLSGRQTLLVRGIECCYGKLNPARSGLWCCANFPKLKLLLVAHSVFSSSCDEPEVFLAEVPCSPYYQKWL